MALLYLLAEKTQRLCYLGQGALPSAPQFPHLCGEDGASTDRIMKKSK